MKGSAEHLLCFVPISYILSISSLNDRITFVQTAAQITTNKTKMKQHEPHKDNEVDESALLWHAPLVAFVDREDKNNRTLNGST